MFTCILVHVVLHHGSGTVYNALLGKKGEEDDIHQKLMEVYPEVSAWTCAALGTVAFSLSIIATQVWDNGTRFLCDHTRNDTPDGIHLANDISIHEYRRSGVLWLFLCD